MKITNESKAVRTINVQDKDGGVSHLTIQGGESVDCNPVQSDTFKGNIAAGTFSVSDDAETKEVKKDGK